MELHRTQHVGERNSKLTQDKRTMPERDSVPFCRECLLWGTQVLGLLSPAAFSIKSEWKRRGFGLPPHTSQLVASGKWNSKLASHQLAVESNLHPGIVSKGLLKCFVWIPFSLPAHVVYEALTNSFLCVWYFWTNTLLSHNIVHLMYKTHFILTHKCQPSAEFVLMMKGGWQSSLVEWNSVKQEGSVILSLSWCHANWNDFEHVKWHHRWECW